MALYTGKDNAWREYVNPLRGLTLESLVAKIEQGNFVIVESPIALGEKPGRLGEELPLAIRGTNLANAQSRYVHSPSGITALTR